MPRWLLVACVLLLGVVSAGPVVAEPEWVERRTEHLVLRYRAGDEVEVDWYAEFVEGAYRRVVDVFGDETRPGIVLQFYPDERSYAAVNPLAAREDGVLAHARPATREVGLAMWRLRKQSEGLRRDAVRHELTHIVLGELSDHKLPIGFHEGLAQYVEQDPDQRAKLLQTLKRGAEADQLLSLADLNRQRTFLGRAAIAYPQSYSLVHFLTERYGFGHVVRMVKGLRHEAGLNEAIQRAFGRSSDELEVEWKASLPDLLNAGWDRNDLDLWELAEPRRLLAEGRYEEARRGFERAGRLFEDLGRGEKVEQAQTGLRQSALALEATELDGRAAAALDEYDYSTAAQLLGEAETRWSAVGDEQRRRRATESLEQARRGVEGLDRLGQAREQIDGWRLPEARASALEAGMTFGELGDVARTEEAKAVLEEAQALQTRLGVAAIGGGAAGLAAIGVAWGLSRRSRRPRYQMPSGVGVGERDWSL